MIGPMKLARIMAMARRIVTMPPPNKNSAALWLDINAALIQEVAQEVGNKSLYQVAKMLRKKNQRYGAAFRVQEAFIAIGKAVSGFPS